MDNKKFKNYLVDFVTILKEHAKSAKRTANNSEGDSYCSGYLMAYHEVISLMKNQAIAFNIDQKEIGLADIEPERDLL